MLTWTDKPIQSGPGREVSFLSSCKRGQSPQYSRSLVVWNYTHTESVADQVEVIVSPSEQLAVNNLEGKVERDIKTQARIW